MLRGMSTTAVKGATFCFMESGSCLVVLGSFNHGWCLTMWKIWSIVKFKGMNVMEPSVFTIVERASSLEAGAWCPLARFLELSGWRFSWLLCRATALDRILLSLIRRSVGVVECWWASEEWPTRISLVPNSMTRCCAFRRTFIYVSSWWLTYVTASRSAVSRWMATGSRSRSAFAMCSSDRRHRANHHLDKLSSGEGCWVKFLRDIDVVMGGSPVCRDRCMKMLSWKGLGYW